MPGGAFSYKPTCISNTHASKYLPWRCKSDLLLMISAIISPHLDLLVTIPRKNGQNSIFRCQFCTVFLSSITKFVFGATFRELRHPEYTLIACFSYFWIIKLSTTYLQYLCSCNFRQTVSTALQGVLDPRLFNPGRHFGCWNSANSTHLGGVCVRLVGWHGGNRMRDINQPKIDVLSVTKWKIWPLAVRNVNRKRNCWDAVRRRRFLVKTLSCLV